MRRIGATTPDNGGAEPNAAGGALPARFGDLVELVVDRPGAGHHRVRVNPPADRPSSKKRSTSPRLASRRREAAAEQLAIDATLALGLRHGPAHSEIRISDDGPYVLEVAGRSSAILRPRVPDCPAPTSTLLLSLPWADQVTIPNRDPHRPSPPLCCRREDASCPARPGPGRRVSRDQRRHRGRCQATFIRRFPEQRLPRRFIGATGATHEQSKDALAWASA